MPEKQVVAFSKEQASEQRQVVAQEAGQLRRDYFEQKKELGQTLAELTLEMQQGKIELEEVESRIESSSQQLDKARSDLLSKILNVFKIKSLHETIGNYRQTSEELKTRLAERNRIIEDLQEVESSDLRLQQAKEMVSRFYEEQGVQLEVHKTVEAAREVEHIIEENDCVMIHSIRPDLNLDGNTLLKKDVTWQLKTDIMLAFHPACSTSTLLNGDGVNNMWGRMGLIVKGGSVRQAFRQDGATRARGIGERINDQHGEATPEDIQQAITNRVDGKDGMNELVVRDPEYAGLYVSLDGVAHQANDIAPLGQIAQYVKERNLKLFVIEAGEVYEGIVNEETNSLTKGQQVDKKKLAQTGTAIDEEARKSLVEGILSESPFKQEKLQIKEADLFQSMAHGREFYIQLNAEQIAHSPNLAYQPYEPMPKEMGIQIKPGSLGALVAEVTNLDKTIQYFVIKPPDEKLYLKTIDRIDVNVTRAVFYANSTIRLGRESLDLESEIGNVDTYITKLAETCHKLRDRLAADPSERNELTLRQAAYHLYGFGESARQFGDEATYQTAFELASQTVHPDDYASVMQKRTDEQGRFKTVEEDLI